jgi:hypothetical protein
MGESGICGVALKNDGLLRRMRASRKEDKMVAVRWCAVELTNRAV